MDLHVHTLRSPWLVLLAIPTILTALKALQRPRYSSLAKNKERVLVLGASSGIGRTIAHLYAGRGARVCVVGRREGKVNEVVEECLVSAGVSGGSKVGQKNVIGATADISVVEDMVRVRTTLETEWQGVDTIIVAAGVSALQPLMAVAGVEVEGGKFVPPQASAAGIQRTVDVASAAMMGNYFGPLVAAVTMIPLLTSTSSSPSILLLSSLAAVIPPPTRTLYASTKSSSLMLYQALSIEHPKIAFSFVIPSTVEGDFRASAVDGGKVREADPNKSGLKREAVAQRCIQAVDYREKTVFMPGFMRFGHFLYWIWPSFVEARARVKYNFP